MKEQGEIGLSDRVQAALDRLEAFAVDVIYERRRGFRVRLFGGFLRAVSWLFGGVVRLRLILYQKGIMKGDHLGCLVIVVGNLTVGGTGKTPVVEKLARSLQERGRKVAILSRGYKSRKEPVVQKWWRWLSHKEAPPPKIVSNGERVLLDSLEAGDEPFMLARNLPGVVVLVDKDRVKAGVYAVRKYGVDTIVLDDGFQYFPLKEHLQVLLIDKSNPFGNGSLLPRGILREPVSHMRRASHIFLTKSDGQRDAGLEAVIQRHKPGLDLIECTHRPQYLMSVVDGDRRPLESLAGKRVGAFCGIATPESFEAFLKGHGAEVGWYRWFVDHHRFSEHELAGIFTEARAAGVDFVVTTEKDAVRLPEDYVPALPLFYLRVEIDIISGVKDFEGAVSRICFPKKPLKATRPPW